MKNIFRFKEIRKTLNLNQKEFAEKLKIKQSQVSEIESGKRSIAASIVLSLIDNLNINRQWLETGEGEMIISKELTSQINRVLTKKGNSTIDIGKGQFVIVMPLIEKQTQLKYLEEYDNEQFLAELPVHCITVYQLQEQYYKAFVVYGCNMNNNTAESICEGDIVVGCEIEQQQWKTTLAANTFKDYIIVHKEGILIKRIIAFDAKTDVVISKSLNPDKNSYPDLDINLKDVSQIFNVVLVTNLR